MTESRKPILCLDFDGVLHSYTSGWQGADVIPDPPVPGAIAFLRDAVKHFRVAIFSSRSNQPGGREAMQDWLQIHADLPSDEDEDTWLRRIEWPTEKPPALVTIDDRAITFTGTWPSIAELLAFKPWNKAMTPALRAADRLSALKAERDRMAAALREIQLEAGGGIEAAREGSPIQHCFIAIHRHAAAALASDAPPLNECARAALSQEPTQ